MRADQILMAGVVLIGGYAVYRLLASPSTGTGPGSTPAAPSFSPATAPAIRRF